MSQLILPERYHIPLEHNNRDRILFGYRLPHLPDFLADHTLIGQTDQEKLSEVLNRWVQFVLGLRKWQGSAYSLRYLAKPGIGESDLAFVCRLECQRDQAPHRINLMLHDVAGQLTTLGIQHEPLDQQSLYRYLFPFSQPYLVEVRQHEEVASFLIPPPPPAPPDQPGKAYVTHPFWSPGGSFLLPFEALLRQTNDVAVNLFLEPTALMPHEREGLLLAAQLAQTYSEQSVKIQSDLSPRSLRDPVASQVSRVYNRLLADMTEPFLVFAQVASPNSSTAVNIARAFGAAITNDRLMPHNELEENRLPSNFDIHTPRDSNDHAAAQQCFAHMAFYPWGNQLATPGKERLVYLAGAKGAAALFRLPISVRGGVPGIAVRQAPPDFEPGPRPQQAGSDELHLGTFRRGGAVTIRLKHLTRHTLIAGFTGAGKTNTVLHLLDQLWKRHAIPFLVIEAAKKEYRGLLTQPGINKLLVFTLGDETTSPFRLNPFELLPGVRLEAHLGGLQNCFDAALPQFGILPSIIAESLEAIYADKGWELTDRGTVDPEHLFPTMKDLLAKVSHVIEERGYSGETYDNIKAAAVGRIGNLLRGSRGRMFGCQRSIPFEVLLQRPAILELNDLNQDDKALTMMFLLMFLREYREMNPAKSLTHITVIEEAHNVMENVQSVGASEVAADTRAKAVEAFSAMLSEVRAYGEGIIISDQSPEKLAPDAVRNTNLQIAHQLRHKTDREAMASAMIMTEAQRDFMGKLRVGEAAVFMTGYDRATFMRVPNYKDDNNFAEPDDATIRDKMAPLQKQFVSSYLPFDGCRFCVAQCQHRNAVDPQTRDPQLYQSFRQAVVRFDERPEREFWEENWRGITAVCRAAAKRAGRADDLDAAWCYLAHEIDFPFTEQMRNSFSEAYKQIS